MNKKLPFTPELLKELAQTYKTPLYIYDKQAIVNQAQKVNQAFGWAENYCNYFAVKATPTPAILKLLANSNMGFDCSSLAELKLVQTSLKNPRIFYTSNNTASEDYIYANSLGAIINLDKCSYLDQVIKALGKPPSNICLRYNPSIAIENDHIIGQPDQSKFGDTKQHILETIPKIQMLGIKNIGLHIMLVSNELKAEVFEKIALACKDLILTIENQFDCKISFINLGGGLGINYHLDDQADDINQIAQVIKNVFQGLEVDIYTEFGRYVTGACGYLLTSVTQGIVESNQTFLTVDLSVNNMNRLLTVEDAYHHVSFVGKDKDSKRKMTIVGSMCIDGDRLFKDRDLPSTAEAGDLIVIHDAGAHCRADATNYNGLLRCGEILINSDGSHQLIRRHETLDDLFATITDI